MTDSPAFRDPVDPAEQPILDSLTQVRDHLHLLKADKSQYVKSADVMVYYNQVIEQVHLLNDIRKEKRTEQNRVDRVLDDVFQLLSLFFLTIGRNNEAPANYATVSTIKRLLDHLKEAGFYTGKDLESISRQLDKIQASLDRGKTDQNPHIILQLETRIQICKVTLAELKLVLSQLSPELIPVQEKLVSILRSISGLNMKATFPIDTLKQYMKELDDMETELGTPAQSQGNPEVPIEEQYAERLRRLSYNQPIPGKELVVDFLGRVKLWAEITLQRQGKFEERFRDQLTALGNIRVQLEKLSLTQAWSLRETDLYSYQRQLDRYDESRVNGDFVDHLGKPAELFEQRGLLYLLRKSYATLYSMLTASEPVSEALVPIYNQLLTLRTCLQQVKRSGGVSSPRELYPYSMKMNSIDSMRVDGKFVVNGDTPEGQGAVHELLSECFDMAFELRNDAEEQEESGAAAGDDEDEDDEPGLSFKSKGDSLGGVNGIVNSSIGVK